MQHRAGRFVHLVKLVNAADAAVGEHQGTGLQHVFTRVGILQGWSCLLRKGRYARGKQGKGEKAKG